MQNVKNKQQMGNSKIQGTRETNQQRKKKKFEFKHRNSKLHKRQLKQAKEKEQIKLNQSLHQVTHSPSLCHHHLKFFFWYSCLIIPKQMRYQDLNLDIYQLGKTNIIQLTIIKYQFIQYLLMGCTQGKPPQKHSAQGHQQPPANLLPEPQLTDHHQNPKDKLDYVLSNTTLDHLEQKKSNYDKLIDNLVQQMKISQKEFPSYNDILVDYYKKITEQNNPGKELIHSSINFMTQEFNQFNKLESFLEESDKQLQQKTFKFLIDLYFILSTMKTEIQLQSYWSGDYMKRYEDQDHHVSIQNDNTNTQISNLNQIELYLKQKIQKAIQNISQRQRQQQLIKINSSHDEVMTKTAFNHNETIVHHAKSQNQKYATPI
ncbi:unnamed protein product [Paramecium octaurelia]|uniref:Uncharacterized protein n=1 Tax=Paramecium octaurelia TaxID=43137 RepID=A0A8S1SS13_PAROT|nr:unnamed protein product [Paramecium octaurelia]